MKGRIFYSPCHACNADYIDCMTTRVKAEKLTCEINIIESFYRSGMRCHNVDDFISTWLFNLLGRPATQEERRVAYVSALKIAEDSSFTARPNCVPARVWYAVVADELKLCLYSERRIG